ncbi:MAG: alpha/beta fold hydrolase [Bacillaceae bacterium]
MVIAIGLVLLVGIKAFFHKEVEEITTTVTATIESEEKIVTIDGEQIYFRKIGEGKYPLFMLHGYGGSAEGFKKLYPHLSKKFTIVAVDMLGFGRSSKPIEDYSFPRQANMYKRLMQKIGYEKFAVLGHSMGGQMALNMAYLYPTQVSHLILVDATGVETLTTGTPSSKPIFDETLKNVSAVSNYEGGKAKSVRPQMYLKKLRISSKAITTPTLIIWGRHDKSVSWEDGEMYHRLLKNSSFHIIEDGGHAPFRQYPDQFLTYVDDFFVEYPLR